MRDKSRGAVVLSIDFELRWGMHHVIREGSDAYSANLLNAPSAAEMLIDELCARRIRATWATVGAIACAGWDDYWMRAPRSPRYAQRRLAVTRAFQDRDPAGVMHFSRPTVLRIRQAPGQELGCHTFSHVLCAREGAVDEDLEADLRACTSLWMELFGSTPRSLVYPCNELCHMHKLVPLGFRVVRAPGSGAVPRPAVLRRAMAAASAIVPPVCHEPCGTDDGLVLTEGSRFVRFGLVEPLWQVHLAALRRSLRGVGAGRVLHLWWHPHNLGGDLPNATQRVRSLLDAIQECMECGGLQSLRMEDLVEQHT